MLNLGLHKIGASMQIEKMLKRLKRFKEVHSVVLNSGKTDRKQNRRQTGLVVFVVCSRPLGRSMLVTSTVVVTKIFAISSVEVVTSLIPGYVWDLTMATPCIFLSSRRVVVNSGETAQEKSGNRKTGSGYPSMVGENGRLSRVRRRSTGLQSQEAMKGELEVGLIVDLIVDLPYPHHAYCHLPRGRIAVWLLGTKNGWHKSLLGGERSVQGGPHGSALQPGPANAVGRRLTKRFTGGVARPI